MPELIQSIYNEPENTAMKQIYKEFIFLGAALAAVAFFCQNTWMMSILIAVNITARFIFAGRRHDWIYLIIGIVAGGGNDMLSMFKGVYYYTPPHEMAIPIPIWILFFWGHIFVAFRQFFRLPSFAGPARARPPWHIDARLIADLAVVVLFRMIIYRWVHHEPIPTIGYAAVLGLRLIALPPPAHQWRLMAAVMIAGPLFEAALIRFGLYVYYNPVFLGMPAWLLIYWAFIIPIFMKGIFDRVEQFCARPAKPVQGEMI